MKLSLSSYFPTNARCEMRSVVVGLKKADKLG